MRMSKVRCQYSDSVFEYDGQNRCPNCGAALGSNPDVERTVREERERAERADSIARQAAARIAEEKEAADRTGRFMSRVFLPVFILIFVTVIIIILFSIVSMRNMFFW